MRLNGRLDNSRHVAICIPPQHKLLKQGFAKRFSYQSDCEVPLEQRKRAIRLSTIDGHAPFQVDMAPTLASLEPRREARNSNASARG
jgi:hypothetical protein